MKKLLILAIFGLTFLLPVSVLAQDTLPNPNTDNSIPTLPIGGGEEPENEPDNQINEDTQQTFVNGVLVGAVVGLIVGGVFTWFLKDKII